MQYFYLLLPLISIFKSKYFSFKTFQIILRRFSLLQTAFEENFKIKYTVNTTKIWRYTKCTILIHTNKIWVTYQSDSKTPEKVPKNAKIFRKNTGKIPDTSAFYVPFTNWHDDDADGRGPASYRNKILENTEEPQGMLKNKPGKTPEKPRKMIQNHQKMLHNPGKY